MCVCALTRWNLGKQPFSFFPGLNSLSLSIYLALDTTPSECCWCSSVVFPLPRRSRSRLAPWCGQTPPQSPPPTWRMESPRLQQQLQKLVRWRPPPRRTQQTKKRTKKLMMLAGFVLLIVTFPSAPPGSGAYCGWRECTGTWSCAEMEKRRKKWFEWKAI